MLCLPYIIFRFCHSPLSSRLTLNLPFTNSGRKASHWRSPPSSRAASHLSRYRFNQFLISTLPRFSWDLGARSLLSITPDRLIDRTAQVYYQSHQAGRNKTPAARSRCLLAENRGEIAGKRENETKIHTVASRELARVTLDFVSFSSRAGRNLFVRLPLVNPISFRAR